MLEAIWAAIDNLVPRTELRDAVDNLAAVVPPPDADPGGEWRSALVERFAVVRRLMPCCAGPSSSGRRRRRPRGWWRCRGCPPCWRREPPSGYRPGYLDASQVATDVVPAGWWRSLVFPPDRPEGSVERAAYVFSSWSSSTSACVAGTSSPPPRHAGPNPEPGCSTVRRGTPPRGPRRAQAAPLADRRGRGGEPHPGHRRAAQHLPGRAGCLTIPARFEKTDWVDLVRSADTKSTQSAPRCRTAPARVPRGRHHGGHDRERPMTGYGPDRVRPMTWDG